MIKYYQFQQSFTTNV